MSFEYGDIESSSGAQRSEPLQGFIRRLMAQPVARGWILAAGISTGTEVAAMLIESTLHGSDALARSSTPAGFIANVLAAVTTLSMASVERPPQLPIAEAISEWWEQLPPIPLGSEPIDPNDNYLI